MMLLRRLELCCEIDDPPKSVIDDSGFVGSQGEVGVIGEDVSGSTSTVSMCVIQPLAIESTDLVEPVVLDRSRYRFTSILLLKYDSKQSSSVTDLPSSESGGMATSSNLSLTNL